MILLRFVRRFALVGEAVTTLVPDDHDPHFVVHFENVTGDGESPLPFIPAGLLKVSQQNKGGWGRSGVFEA